MKKWFSTFFMVFIIVGLITGCSGENQESQEEDNTSQSQDTNTDNDKPFEGESLTLYLANHVWGEGIESLLPEFEEQTGIEVDLQSFAENQLTSKVTVELTAGSDTPDVFMFRPGNEGALLLENGWVEPLDEYVNRDSSYDINDFSKPSLSAVTFDDKLIGIPGVTAQHILYYRKDLLEEAGVSVPQTMDELKEAVDKVHDPENDVYGFVARGQTAALVTMLSSFIFSEGGDFMDGDKATVNSPEAVRAATTYGNLLSEYGPPGAMNMEWPQATALFAEGKAAFYPDGSPMFPNFTDPESSKITDVVGYASIPAGEAGSRPFNVTPWGLTMNSSSSNKDAAWELMKWITNKENTLKTQQMGNAGARMSAWEHPDGAEAFPKEIVKVIQAAGENGVAHQLPEVTAVGESRDIIGKIVNDIMQGEDPQTAADRQNALFQEIIDNE
ncbi:ABC transporter substrate-binding protein [Radiobacillus sp. PE A8.2]|uniref:ABC transporter substrate-binding protein n=1 Tax=Radiobacillus sp. PE A8.2 TaxID=3380349 RepID=UPI00388E6346